MSAGLARRIRAGVQSLRQVVATTPAIADTSLKARLAVDSHRAPPGAPRCSKDELFRVRWTSSEVAAAGADDVLFEHGEPILTPKQLSGVGVEW